jgi:hypothetical protein
MPIYEAIASTKDIIEKNAGPIIEAQKIEVPNTSIYASNQLVTTQQGQYLVKQSDVWYLAGKITHFFDGSGVTINASIYDEVIIPRQLLFIFITKEEQVYVCRFDTLRKYDYKVTQPDEEVVYVVSWRKFVRWQ